MHALLARGRLRLLELELGGRSVAMLYGYRLGDRFYYFQSGFDPGVAPLSPGELLLGYAIESAILEGCTTFDMLKGDYDHKRHFFQQTRGTVGVKAYRPGVAAWAYRCKEWLDARAKPPHGANQPQSRQTADVEAG
ncbi:GNAT family N-acetyltransferase, partial [Thiomonas sp. 13-64-67]|uniref:GNAT family N-acetyltransferase n=1 Tax=Thiomonas sp. 13-64-67 TaxID=1970447 RepID=UPI000BCFE84F